MAELIDSGLRYCTSHHGVIDVDQESCDFVDPKVDRCPACEGDGYVERDGETVECGACEGSCATLCSPRPLRYESGE